jgi:hypothetical protein
MKALVFKSNIRQSDGSETWVSHLLDLDIVSQGRSQHEAALALLEALALTEWSAQEEGSQRGKPAPQEYWDEWKRATPIRFDPIPSDAHIIEGKTIKLPSIEWRVELAHKHG